MLDLEENSKKLQELKKRLEQICDSLLCRKQRKRVKRVRK